MRYPGGKNLDGTWQRIINQIPPHEVYCEPFLGSGAILRHKRPAEVSYAVDLEPRSIDLVRPEAPPGTIFHAMDGIKFLTDYLALAGHFGWSVFVYCDPPYLQSTRRCPGRRYYRHEMSPADHRRLLEVLVGLPRIEVMISGYQSRLYDRLLKGWRIERFTATTRGGPAEEVLWMNYPTPTELHDSRYIGTNWRKRLDFRRLVGRWARRFRALDPTKQAAVLAALTAEGGPGAPGGPAAADLPGGSAAGRRKTSMPRVATQGRPAAGARAGVGERVASVLSVSPW